MGRQYRYPWDTLIPKKTRACNSDNLGQTLCPSLPALLSVYFCFKKTYTTCLLLFCHCDGYLVVSYCGFNLQFLLSNAVEYLSPVLICLPLISSLKKYLFKSCSHFLNWIVFLLLSFEDSLWILDTNFLLYIWTADIFSQL